MAKKPKLKSTPQKRARDIWLDANRILLEKHGTTIEVAKVLRRTRQAISTWSRVPIEQVHAVSKLTGIPPHKLRPDLPDIFPKP